VSATCTARGPTTLDSATRKGAKVEGSGTSDEVLTGSTDVGIKTSWTTMDGEMVLLRS
jgi:hypothetical protein